MYFLCLYLFWGCLDLYLGVWTCMFVSGLVLWVSVYSIKSRSASIDYTLLYNTQPQLIRVRGYMWLTERLAAIWQIL